MAHLFDVTRVATVAGLAALTLAAAMVGASPVSAGYWMRSSCINPGGTAASNEGWSSLSNGGGYGSTNSVACGPGMPMFALLSTAERVPVGAHQTLVYTPPAGSTLSGGVLGVELLADGRGHDASGVAAVYTPAFVYDASNVVFQCAWGLGPCANDSNRYIGPVALPPNRGGSLYVSASCGGSPGAWCSEGGSDGVWARVRVFYANVLLTSGFAPTASDFRGSLLSGEAHGTATLSFATQVAGGPGIYKVLVSIDGKPVYDATPNTNGGRCAHVGVDGASAALVFAYQQPCPRAQTVDLKVRTTTLRDGSHELAVVVSDAAQNSQTVLRQAITVNNRTTTSSTLMSDPPGSVADPQPGAAPSAADPVYALALDSRTQALARGVRNVWARSAITLRGTLRSSAGVPAAGVGVALFARSAFDVTPRVVAQATTDTNGRWTLRAPRGPSRTLTIGYGARPDPASAHAISIRQKVRPGISLAVKVLGGARLRFTGRMRIEPLGSPRPLLDIQSLNPSRIWQDVGTSFRVGPTGAYAVTFYGGEKVVGFSYAFRTVARATALYSTGTSKIRRARVR